MKPSIAKVEILEGGSYSIRWAAAEIPDCEAYEILVESPLGNFALGAVQSIPKQEVYEFTSPQFNALKNPLPDGSVIYVIPLNHEHKQVKALAKVASVPQINL